MDDTPVIVTVQDDSVRVGGVTLFRPRKESEQKRKRRADMILRGYSEAPIIREALEKRVDPLRAWSIWHEAATAVLLEARHVCETTTFQRGVERLRASTMVRSVKADSPFVRVHFVGTPGGGIVYSLYSDLDEPFFEAEIPSAEQRAETVVYDLQHWLRVQENGIILVTLSGGVKTVFGEDVGRVKEEIERTLRGEEFEPEHLPSAAMDEIRAAHLY